MVVTMIKIRYVFIVSFICCICLVFSGCFYGNASVRDAEKQLVNDEAIFEDVSGTYQIAFHAVLYNGDTYARGGTWYMKNEKTKIFTFVFGPEAGSLLILSNDTHIASMDWYYTDEGHFVVSGISALSGTDLDESLRPFADQTYVFKQCGE